MKALTLALLAGTIYLLESPATQAATIFFDLQGQSGAGLLAGNEVGTVNGTPGTGGEVGTGIFFDDVSKLLTINVGWGSLDGFTGSLTGTATGMHLHGPAGFAVNAGVLVGLDSLAGFSNLANGGGFNGSITLTPANETHLLNGNLYINVHTAASGGGLNPGGEIRGNLVVSSIPEPGTWLAAAFVAGGIWLRNKRGQKRMP